jgi:hypothetical protein
MFIVVLPSTSPQRNVLNRDNSDTEAGPPGGRSSIHRKADSQLLFQALNFLTVVSSGLMMWKGLCLVTNSESPIVVVLS